MTEEQFAALVASIRTRVGQIKKANNNTSPNSWGQIEVACDKLRAEADAFERAYQQSQPGPLSKGADFAVWWTRGFPQS